MTPSELSKTIMETLSVLAWPLVVMVAMFLFRKPLGEAIRKIMRLKVEAGKFRLETVKSSIVESMQTYVPPKVLAELKQNPEQLRLGGEVRNVTILHSDIKGFTAFHETASPEEVAIHLNEYLTEMTNIVFRFGGTLDSYAGHALTAYWGAPISYEDSADRACNSAVNMLKVANNLSPVLVNQYRLPPLSLSIGITTGNVLVGNFGSAQRFKYTIMGDTLSLAESLCNLNRQFRTQILITEETCQKVVDRFKTRLLQEQVRIPGTPGSHSVYELISSSSDVHDSPE